MITSLLALMLAVQAAPSELERREAALVQRGLGSEVKWLRQMLADAGHPPAEAERRAVELTERGLTGQQLHALKVRGIDLLTPGAPEPDPARFAAVMNAIRALENMRGIESQAAMYALSEGVTLAEAQRRMRLQHREDIGRLGQTLKAREAATFGGLWIQHQPEWKVIVTFTRDPEATLRKYTSDPIFEARPAKISEAELDGTARRAFDVLQQAGVSFAGGTDIIEGVVRIDLVEELAEVERKLAAKKLTLPPHVKLVPPRPLSFAAAPPPVDGPVKIFPRARERTGMITQELTIGRLVLEDGCIRLVSRERPYPVAFFAHEMGLDLSRPDEVRVKNLRSGESFRVGERVAMSGGAGRIMTDDPQLPEIERACGPGPVAWVSMPESYAGFRESLLTGHARARAETKGITFEQAVREMRAEWAREDAIAELDRRLREEAPERYGGMTGGPRGARLLFTEGGEELVKRHAPPEALGGIEIAPAPISVAGESRVRTALQQSLAAAGVKAGIWTDIETGIMTLQTEDVASLSRAATEGRVALPPTLRIQTNGALGTSPPRQGSFEAAMASYARAPDFAEIQKMVAATSLPAEWTGAPEGARGESRPGPRQAADVAQWLKGFGFSAERIRALRVAGFDPVRSWIAMNGRATPVDRALIAGETVVAELVSIDPRQAALGDDRRTTARFRIVETLAGTRKPGEIVTVRFVSGYDRDGRFQQANDEPIALPGLPGSLDEGGRYLLSLSAPLYEHAARVMGVRPAAPAGERWYVPYGEPRRVEGDVINPGRFEGAAESLPQLREQLRRLGAALAGG